MLCWAASPGSLAHWSKKWTIFCTLKFQPLSSFDSFFLSRQMQNELFGPGDWIILRNSLSWLLMLYFIYGHDHNTQLHNTHLALGELQIAWRNRQRRWQQSKTLRSVHFISRLESSDGQSALWASGSAPTAAPGSGCTEIPEASQFNSDSTETHRWQRQLSVCFVSMTE